jgi:hypothetical protein
MPFLNQTGFDIPPLHIFLWQWSQSECCKVMMINAKLTRRYMSKVLQGEGCETHIEVHVYFL